MSIVYYPNRVYKKYSSPVDMLTKKQIVSSTKSRKSISSEIMDELIYRENDWTMKSLSFNFSNTTPRNYYAKILTGRTVVKNMNDYFWIGHSVAGKQKITLDVGFYDSGTSLSEEIKDKLDNNAAFLAAGLTFAVSYNTTTGLFSITVDSGNIRYINVNISQKLSSRDSIGGHLFGFNSNSALANTIISDTPVFSLGEEVSFLSVSAGTSLEHLFDESKLFNIDQALHIYTNTANVEVGFNVNLQDI